MKQIDVAVVGAGVLGCFAARALSAYCLDTMVLEAREDVCTGVSRANTGIVYTGYDTRPNTLKTELCIRSNAQFSKLCEELEVPFKRCGSLMVGFGERAESILNKKYEQGMRNGVPGLQLLGRAAVLEQEPHLSTAVTCGMLASNTGVVNPWALGIAAAENAAANGVEFHFCEKLRHMERRDGGFVLETEQDAYVARAVLNCAGLSADTVRELTERPSVRIFPTAADYLILDDTVGDFLRHVIFHEPEQKGKGLTLIPTVDGNLMVGPTERPWNGKADYATEQMGLEELYTLCRQVAPELPLDQVIRNFGALRPNPYYVTEKDGAWAAEEKSISNFTVLQERGLYSLIGIKTPGLTCAAALGSMMAERIADDLHCDRKNSAFDPRRRGILTVRSMEEAQWAVLAEKQPEYGEIVCRCRQVTEGEILEAIHRGAVTVDGVKRRVGTGMGRCQGSRCMQRIMELLARERHVPVQEIFKDGSGSALLYGDSHETI